MCSRRCLFSICTALVPVNDIYIYIIVFRQATTKEALYDMPDKAGVYGVAMTLIMLQRLARANL